MKIAQTVQPFLLYGEVEKLYAPTTQRQFRACLRAWIVPIFGERELSSLTRLDVLDFRKAMIDRSLSVNRQYSVLMVLKLLLRFAGSVLKVDCLEPAEIKLPRRAAGPVQALTVEEIAATRAATQPDSFHGLRLRVLVEVLLGTGMRISEALSLNRDSINWEQAEAAILGKGSKPRTVFFPEVVLAWLRLYLKKRADSNPALFVTTGGAPRRWTVRDMPKLFAALRSRAQISKHLTPHLLRHTFCTQLLQNGADITYIKELAGHQDIDTTARYYLGVDKKALKDVLRRCQRYDWAESAPDPRLSEVG